MTDNVHKFPLKKHNETKYRFQIKIMLCNSFKLARKDQKAVDEAQHFYTHNGLREKQNTIDLYEQRLDMILYQYKKLERLNWFDRLTDRLCTWNNKRIEKKIKRGLNIYFDPIICVLTVVIVYALLIRAHIHEY